MSAMTGQCVVRSATVRGVEALPVDVEVVVGNGMPGMFIVGMPDAAIQESRERIRAAIRASGFSMPNERVVVNLAPGSLRKSGSGFDLPIAVGILTATGQIDARCTERRLVVGELSLEGAVRPVTGALAYALCAKEAGCDVLTAPCATGYVHVDGVRQLVAASLSSFRVGAFSEGKVTACRRERSSPDFSDVAGHEMAKRALQIAAAGSHGVLMMGRPRFGKDHARLTAGFHPPRAYIRRTLADRAHPFGCRRGSLVRFCGGAAVSQPPSQRERGWAYRGRLSSPTRGDIPCP